MKKSLLLFILILLSVPAVPAGPQVSNENWELFRQVYSLVLDTYVEPKSPDELITGALEGLAAATGPECGYIPKNKMAETDLAGKSDFFLPLYITKDGGFANVISTFPGEDKEIEPGDLLRFINGKSVFDMNYPQMMVALKGAGGEEATCGFIKKGTFKPFEKKLTVKKAVMPVLHDFKEKGLAVEIPCIEAEFDQSVKDKMAKASGRVVIDLRGCASSDEKRAVVLAGMLFGAGNLKFASKNGNSDIPFSGEGILKDKDVVVIVDKTTARSGEVLALASAKNGPLIGEETFGFSAMHETVALKNGDGLVILTGYFLDKEGKEVKDNPLKPDFIFDVSEKSRKDDFYLKAILKNFPKEKNGSS
jgi:carboxyl-terminal processing protease